jgi:sporulation-control protein
MLKNIFASFGFGAAKVDLVLDYFRLKMGQPVTGKIVLTGGQVEQAIEGLEVEFRLASAYQRGDNIVNVNETIATIPVTEETFQVAPEETREYPFTFVCPEFIPASSVNTRYYFQTNLEIKSGIDAQDRDFVDVYPSGLQEYFWDGFNKLGFVPQEEGYTGKKGGGFQIIQFRPTEWLRGEYDEIVFMFQPAHTQNGVAGFFELDKKGKGLLGLLADELDLDEKKGRFVFTKADLTSGEYAAETIRQFINHHSKDLIG